MRCKVGDLVVVKSISNKNDSAQNIGRFGTVTEAVTGYHKTYTRCDWFVIPKNTFWGHDTNLKQLVETKDEVAFFDRDLIPIPPGSPDDDTETTKELDNGTHQEADLHHV